MPYQITLTANPAGTSRQGTLNITYQQLVHLFGKPGCYDDYKSDAEWIMDINGHTITIYNYKNGKNYLGSKGTPTSKITDWNVGGHNRTDYDILIAYIVFKIMN